MFSCSYMHMILCIWVHNLVLNFIYEFIRFMNSVMIRGYQGSRWNTAFHTSDVLFKKRVSLEVHSFFWPRAELPLAVADPGRLGPVLRLRLPSLNCKFMVTRKPLPTWAWLRHDSRPGGPAARRLRRSPRHWQRPAGGPETDSEAAWVRDRAWHDSAMSRHHDSSPCLRRLCGPTWPRVVTMPGGL